jgi:hypothetical protein
MNSRCMHLPERLGCSVEYHYHVDWAIMLLSVPMQITTEQERWGGDILGPSHLGTLCASEAGQSLP